ncbi:MAG: vWA domain-containing protein, partial [Planctomycetota bacterium]
MIPLARAASFADDPTIAGTALRFVGPLPVWAALCAAGFAAALAWRFYLREAAHLSRSYRWGLPALRSLAFVLGVLLLCAPALVRTRVEGELGRVRVLVDGSDSMTRQDAHLPDARQVRLAEALGRLPAGTAERFDALAPQPDSGEEPSTADAAARAEIAAKAAAALADLPRWRRADLLLAESPNAVLPSLRERHAVTVRTLDGPNAEPRSYKQAEGEENAEPAEPAAFSPITDLATPLADGAVAATGEALAEATGPRAAVVLLTDGRHNDGPSATEAAKALGEAGIAMFPVLFGADEPAADLAVSAVTAPDLVFKTDRVRGTFALRDT